MDEAVTVLYRDERLLALDKPSGMLVHRGWARAPVTMVDIARELSGREVVHPLGRLDRCTSGVMLFVLDVALVQQLQAAGLGKRYLALVRGVPPAAGLIDHPLRRSPRRPAREAHTDYERLCTLAAEPRALSLVVACPRHGRLHQVRRHLKHLAHPVIGDANYGKGPLNRAIAERYGLRRLALHAFELRLPDGMRLRAPLPPDLLQPLLRMGLEPGLLPPGLT